MQHGGDNYLHKDWRHCHPLHVFTAKYSQAICFTASHIQTAIAKRQTYAAVMAEVFGHFYVRFARVVEAETNLIDGLSFWWPGSLQPL